MCLGKQDRCCCWGEALRGSSPRRFLPSHLVLLSMLVARRLVASVTLHNCTCHVENKTARSFTRLASSAAAATAATRPPPPFLYTSLASTRAIMPIAGTDSNKFLQGLVTNDVRHIGRGVYAFVLKADVSSRRALPCNAMPRADSEASRETNRVASCTTSSSTQLASRWDKSRPRRSSSTIQQSALPHCTRI